MLRKSVMIFEKYSANGNDFLITHNPPHRDDFSDLARALCHRSRGIGADGLVILHPHASYAYEWEFYNSDGSEASMCGNASQCVGIYAYLQKLTGLRHCFLSGAGVIEVEILSAEYPYRIRSVLGAYRFIKRSDEWFLFDTGVPHLIYLAKSKEEFDSLSLQAMRELRVIHNANVNIAYKDCDHYRIKTYERGVEGVTLACGTGMASLVALLCETNQLPSPQLSSFPQISAPKVSIIPPAGEALCFSLGDRGISFEGEVRRIARCELNLNDFGIQQ